MPDRLEELEWLITNETDGEIRAQNIKEYNELWEARYGRGCNNGSGEGYIRKVCEDI